MIRQVFLFLYPLLILETSKLFFLYINNIPVKTRGIVEFGKVAFYSLRFDGFILLITVLPVFIALMFINLHKKKQLVPLLRCLYTLLVFLICLISVADTVYYRAALHRLSIYDVEVLISNFAFFSSIMEEYWYLMIIILATTFFAIPVFNKVFESLSHQPESFKRVYLKAVISIFCFWVLIWDFSYGRFLTPSSVFSVTSHQNLPAIVNAPAELLFSYRFKARQQLELDHLDNDIAYRLNTHFYNDSIKPVGNETRQNIVVCILEGGSAEDFKEGTERKQVMPFLDSLIAESLSFDNFFANALNSASGFDAVIGGMPQFDDGDFYSLGYSQNAADFAPQMLKEMGYTNYFFYGVKEFRLSLNKSADYYGLDNRFGAEDAGWSKKGIGSNYGIHDHIFFPRIAMEMKNIETPFFSVIYNISTHYPFNLIPEKMLDGFPDFDKPRKTVLHYYDKVFRKFFNDIKYQAWFPNTTFLFVADHYSRDPEISIRNSIDIFRIPMFIFKPGSLLKGRNTKAGQQIDILPTILEIAGYNGRYFAFGRSLFDSSGSRTAVNFHNSIAQIVTEDYVLKYDRYRKRLLGLYDYHKDPSLTNNKYALLPNQADSLLIHLKAFMQVFSRSLRTNQMSRATYRTPLKTPDSTRPQFNK